MDYPKEDHSERDFKRLIIGGILDQLQKSSKARKTSHKWSTIKIIASMLELLKTFPEIIVAPKCGPLAWIEKQAVS